MQHYLLKSYDARGRLLERFEFSAPNDVEAEGAVLDLESERTQELWRGTRWLRTWPAGVQVFGRGARPREARQRTAAERIHTRIV